MADRDMDISNDLTVLAGVDALRGQLHNLEQTTGRLVRLQKSLPESLVRDRLLEEINALDSIADVIRQALDSIYSLE